MCPTKTQMGLSIHAVWSESLLSTWRNIASLAVEMPFEDSAWSDCVNVQADLNIHFTGHICPKLRFLTLWLKFYLLGCYLFLPARKSGRICQTIALKTPFFNQKVLIFFLFLHKNICCGYSSEVPWRGTSNEYPQHMFLWRNKKNIYWVPTLI